MALATIIGKDKRYFASRLPLSEMKGCTCGFVEMIDN
jgi:hypothetical protein